MPHRAKPLSAPGHGRGKVRGKGKRSQGHYREDSGWKGGKDESTRKAGTKDREKRRLGKKGDIWKVNKYFPFFSYTSKSCPWPWVRIIRRSGSLKNVLAISTNHCWRHCLLGDFVYHVAHCLWECLSGCGVGEMELLNLWDLLFHQKRK